MGSQTRTNIYACWIMHTRHHLHVKSLKVARKELNFGEDWNPVFCHGNKTFKLVLWSILSIILLPRIKHFWSKLAEISFSSYLIKIWLSIWRHHLANLHILKTWISLEQKEIFENSKRHFCSRTDYFLCLKMASIGKMRFSSKFHLKFREFASVVDNVHSS